MEPTARETEERHRKDCGRHQHQRLEAELRREDDATAARIWLIHDGCANARQSRKSADVTARSETDSVIMTAE